MDWRHAGAVALLAALAAAGAWAAVDVEIRNGDKVTGTISPASETEILRFRVPKGALITAKASAAKKGLLLRVRLKDPNGADVGVPIEGKSATFSKKKAEVSGLYSVEITSKDGVAVGDYAFAATWKSPTSFGGKYALAAAVPYEVNFSADAGATATLAVKKTTKKSTAAPALTTLTYPDATIEGLLGVTQMRLLDRTGDCVLAVSSATAGDATATVKVKAPKASKRKYALTQKAIGAGVGAAAFSSIVGPEGGPIVFPPVAPGQPGAELVGSGVVVPAGALPVGTSIVISTAPDIPTSATQTGAGATVAFGPDGLRFGTSTAPKAATVTIPFDATFAPLEDQITVYTRDAKGVVTPVAGPYAFDVVAGTVSFATSHFSSFRAVAATNVVRAGDFPTFASLAYPLDACDAHDPGAATATKWTVHFVAEGAARVVGALRTTDGTSTTLTHETWVGGGTQTTTPAARAQFQFADDVNTVFARLDGVLYVGTTTQVFLVDPSTGVVSLLAGTGAVGDSGDNGPALQATFTNIRNIVATLAGVVYVVDGGAHRVRFIDASAAPTISRWAGDGSTGVGADGGAVQTTAFIGPSDVAFAPGGGLYVADGARIRLLDPFAAPGQVNVTVAGSPTGATGATGDDGPPGSATFRSIAGISHFVDPSRPTIDGLVVADAVDHTVRLVDFTNGAVKLLAGSHGTPGFNGDTGSKPGLLNTPLSVVSDPGVVIVCDKGNGRVRAFTYP